MENLPIKVAPSLLSFDFGHLADEAKRIEDAGADAIHIDVMDGHFVPNLTLGPKAVAAIRHATKAFLDVHIMVYNPFDYVERMVESGADRLTFHFESTEDVADVLAYIRRCNIQAGLSFRPETSQSMCIKYLDKCDMLLFMTVNPGFGGQEFMPEVLEKVSLTRKMCNDLKIPLDIQVDGGITDKTAKLSIEAGANCLVSGTWLYEQKDLAQGIQALKQCAKEKTW